MSDGALWLLGIAVMISSISLAANAIAAVGTFRAVKKLRDDFTPLVPEIKETLVSAQQLIQEAAKDARELSSLGREVLEGVRTQVDELGKTRDDLTQQVKIHGERVELVVEDVMNRIQDVVGIVHGSVVKPVREVSGVVAGVKAAVQTFLMGRRPSVARATHDEEMFI